MKCVPLFLHKHIEFSVIHISQTLPKAELLHTFLPVAVVGQTVRVAYPPQHAFWIILLSECLHNPVDNTTQALSLSLSLCPIPIQQNNTYI